MNRPTATMNRHVSAPATGGDLDVIQQIDALGVVPHPAETTMDLGQPTGVAGSDVLSIG